MQSIDVRLSKIEAVQHFQLAMIGAVAKSLQDQVAFRTQARGNLELHHAMLLAESTDELKLSTFQQLMAEILGPDSDGGQNV